MIVKHKSLRVTAEAFLFQTMNKPWLGFLSSFLFLIAGILMFASGKIWLGVLFLIVAVAGAIVKVYTNKKTDD